MLVMKLQFQPNPEWLELITFSEVGYLHTHLIKVINPESVIYSLIIFSDKDTEHGVWSMFWQDSMRIAQKNRVKELSLNSSHSFDVSYKS